MSLRQLRVGNDNFSYLLHCASSRKAILVDPSGNASEAMRLIGSENLEIIAVVNTHHHGDHITDNNRVIETYGCALLASKADSGRIDGVAGFLEEGQVIHVGRISVEVLLTPGHTPGSICLLADGKSLLTGDTLFIGDCGRTDMPGGDDRAMYDTLQRLKALPDDVIIYPGHDYGPKPFDTMGNQRKTNKVLLARTYEEFARIQ